MIELVALPDGKVRVTFTLTLKHELKPGVKLPISEACVVGDFNDWDPKETPLRYVSALEKEGFEFRTFRGEAVVEAGNISEYRFLVDGLHSWPDPDNPHKIPNAQGGENSILETPLGAAAKEPLPRPKALASGRPALKKQAGLGSPEDRLAEAAKVFEQAMTAGLPPEERIGPLALAVRLDPYEPRYRLALTAAERDAGHSPAAAAEGRKALALWPDEPRFTLLLAQALLDAGQIDEAKVHLARVPGDGDLGRQRAFDLVEASIRQAQGPEDWKKVLDELERLDVETATAGLFCEKCLKTLTEAESAEITEKLRALAATKLAGLQGHPAYSLFERLASFDPSSLLKNAAAGAELAGALPGETGPTGPAELERFLKAYRLSNIPLDGGDGPASRIEGLAAWRRLIKTHGRRWPEIADAYIRQLDRWGVEAYRDKKFELAGVLWGEAERVDPANPAVLQNLALVHTRGKDERGYDWYWSRLVKTLVLQGEIAPWSGDYARGLKEKHQAFVEGLQKAVPLAGDWRQALRLGAQMARETVSLLALRQIAFKNPLFRCGVCREDYAGPDERDQRVLQGTASLEEWLKLAAEWEGLPEKDSALEAWRSDRLNEALGLAREGGPALNRSYDEERTAFKAHRGQAAQQFLGLLMVLKQVSEQSSGQSAAERADGMDVARAVMSFPHDLIKPALVEMKALEPGTNVRELATNYAVLPWFAPAQSDFEQKRYEAALEKFRTVQTVAPDFLTGRFYVAQCCAALGSFGEAFDTAVKALRDCPADDKLRPHLVQSIPQILMGWAGPLMQKERWTEARDILARAAAAGVPDGRVSFYQAICHARAGQAKPAQTAARKALLLARKGGDKDLEKEIQDFIPQIPGLMIATDLNKAQAAMNKQSWREALFVLDEAVAKAPDSAFAQFLKALCHFNLSEIDAAEQAAAEGLKHADRPGLEEIKKQLQQVAAAAASHKRAALINPLIAAMNAQRWYEASGLSAKAVEAFPFDDQVHYYRALILFQVCMSEVRSRGGFRTKSDGEAFIEPRFAKIVVALHGFPDTALDNDPGWFDRIYDLKYPGEFSGASARLGKIARLLADASFFSPDLKKGLDQLRQAMAGILSQLSKLPSW